ncbi:UvrB/UvrC motif-containing protein [Treponema sp. Marseille-Q3903]|uniref:UvrB/UvrC motif-containing protein n=1 Tax=Treponema sp. Marseille-Q3903 TaxID=2766703 RepID=UPI001652758C|nr:UvrB/UvrC motif-containing protein [Treponema sp. Marseille-Q3903]MBC6713404.1 UvrB/UvrC motif-containing protein [Treponema sp. Marseille-Q3903]
MKCCRGCCSTYEDIRKSQNIGCAECYYTFAEEFRESLKKYGVTERYKGSLPKRLKGYNSTLVDKMTLQIKLEEALQAEEYEKAALYRDYLKVLNDGK